MATKKKQALKTTRRVTKKAAAKKQAPKAVTKKAAVTKQVKRTSVKKTAKASSARLASLPQTQVLYIDSAFFFPAQSSNGYQEISQAGRISNMPGTSLMAALPLPVGTVLQTVTFYYKNVSAEDMPVDILKKHINHRCGSGEIEVALDSLPPATVPPDDYAEKVVNHFSNSGQILDEYLYFIEVWNTVLTENEQRSFRGVRIEYSL